MVSLPLTRLLVLFTLAAPAAVAQQRPLPPHTRTSIVIRLLPSGPSINNQAVPWGKLAAELHAIYGKRPEKRLYLAPSSSGRAEDFKRLLVMAKREGILVLTLRST